MARQSLDQWIREIFTDEELKTNYGKVTRLALVHISGKDTEIYTLNLKGKQWDPLELAKLFKTKAQNHAAELPGTQTFNLLAFFEDRPESQARRAFTEKGLDSLEDSEYVTEAPTAKGMVAQCMRHNEAVLKLALQQTGSMVESCTRMLDKVSNMFDRAMGENREMFTLLRESAMAQVTENSAIRQKQLEFQRGTDMRNRLIGLIPAAVNGIVGKEILPTTMEDTSIIEAMAEGLNEKEIAALQQVVRPEVMGLLTRRMTKYLDKKKEARDQAMVALARANIEDAEFESAAE